MWKLQMKAFSATVGKLVKASNMQSWPKGRSLPSSRKTCRKWLCCVGLRGLQSAHCICATCWIGIVPTALEKHPSAAPLKSNKVRLWWQTRCHPSSPPPTPARKYASDKHTHKQNHTTASRNLCRCCPVLLFHHPATRQSWCPSWQRRKKSDQHFQNSHSILQTFDRRRFQLSRIFPRGWFENCHFRCVTSARCPNKTKENALVNMEL